MNEVNKSEFWNRLYSDNSAGWDLKSPTPAFMDLLDSVYFRNKNALLVLGCGYGYDAIEAAKKNFEVTAIDFSEAAILFAEKLAAKENVKVNFLVKDFFEIEDVHFNNYDIIYDYVTYCAIDPERRKEYAELISNLLAPNGIFAIILFPVEKRDGGPPFAVDVDEATGFFSEKLQLVLSTDKINSIKPRKGRELLQIYRKPYGTKS